jgi:pectate lyase
MRHGILGLMAILSCASAGERPGAKYVAAVRAFAECVLEHGRDTYGREKTPLFIDGLHARTLAPALWERKGEKWALCNVASQQPLFRLLDGLTRATGEPKYREAADAAARYALKKLQSPNGLLYWGGHLAWDLGTERPVGQYADIHELKGHQPYYRLLYRVDPAATARLMAAVWATHILDWALLDYNRHASVRKPAEPKWDHPFRDDVTVPFPAKGGNLSFVNVTPPLLHSGTMLAILGRSDDALTWTRRLILRWQQGRDAKTGLCGGQLSYRKNDRAQEALGHVHPNINEAKIVASYHQTCRYHQLPLAQMQAGESLIEAGGRAKGVGHEFIRWASEDLQVYARRCYDPKAGAFRAVTTDGTRIQWKESRTGYYVPSSFAPRKPDGLLLWSYATAYRLTGERAHWDMARRVARARNLGDIGQPDGGRSLRLDTASRDWRAIYALLELHRATKDPELLRLGCRIGDNLLPTQAKTGLFPRQGRDYARTGDEVPLALLHLAVALAGKQEDLPRPIYDSRFFHCQYDGKLKDHQKKRADSRTYDHLVFYGGS